MLHSLKVLKEGDDVVAGLCTLKESGKRSVFLQIQDCSFAIPLGVARELFDFLRSVSAGDNDENKIAAI